MVWVTFMGRFEMGVIIMQFDLEIYLLMIIN